MSEQLQDSRLIVYSWSLQTVPIVLSCNILISDPQSYCQRLVSTLILPQSNTSPSTRPNSDLAMSPSDPQHIAILGAGIIGLTSSLVLAHAYPDSQITVVAKHFPGDRSIEYTSPWAGANWSSMANDNGPLENYDRVTFQRFGQIMDGKSVHGVKVFRSGEGNEAGLGRQQMWAVLDSPIEQTNMLTPQTGNVWYDELVGGLRKLDQTELPEGAVFGLEFPSTFRINTQVYLQWYVSKFAAEMWKNYVLMQAGYSPRL